MENGLIEVSWLDVSISFGLVAVSIGLLYFQGIGMEKDLLIGAIRSLIQLGLIGYVLIILFNLKSLLVIIVLLVLMGLVAALTARGRIKKPFPNAVPVLWFSITVGSLIALGFITTITMRDPTALTPRYLIPLGGMIIGNVLNGMSLAAERFRSELISGRERVECLLSMGATAERASHMMKKSALIAAMIPTINSLMIIGLIQIPGVMTGQILTGNDPLMAAKYQIIIMFMIVGGKTMALSLGLKLIARQYFTSEHQLRPELL